jgi:glycosyltransferase involved in cell wall biosynthesis
LVPAEANVVDLGVDKLRKIVLPLARYLRERRPYAMHVMMWPLPLLTIAARAIARVDTRIIGSEHTTLSTMPHGLRKSWVRALTRRAYLQADGLIAVSAGVADDLSAFVGLPRERITVIHNPLLLPAALPNPASAVARWPANTKRILAVGALKAEKNYPLLLRALTRVRERMPASLLILGDGPLRGALELQVADMGLVDAVVFAGFSTDPWPFYAAADLFVLSSDCEGFGNVLVEAMHAGLPIVSTDCPNGPREILADGAYGALVPCSDEAALAGALMAEDTMIDPAHLRYRAAMLSSGSAIDAHAQLLIGKAE